MFPETGYFGGWMGGWLGQFPAMLASPDEVQAAEQKVAPAEPLDRERDGWFGLVSSGGMGLGFDQAPPLSIPVIWQMRKYSAIVLAYAVAIAPFLAGSRSIEVAGSKPPADAEKWKGNAIADGLDQLAESWLEPACECMHFGHWLQEIVWDRKNNRTVPVRFKSILPGAAVLLRDTFNEFVGFKLGTEFRDARYALLSVNLPHIDPIFGYSRDENARVEWWRVRQSEMNADKTEGKASSRQMAIYWPMGQSFIGDGGVPMFAKDFAQTAVNAAVAGQAMVLPKYLFKRNEIASKPELADVKPVDVQMLDWGDTGPAIMSAIARADAIDKRIMRAWGRPERESMEGLHGTKAEAGTHGAIGTTDSERIHSARCREFDQQVLDRWLVANRGPGSEGMLTLKPAPLSDPQQQFLQAIAQALVTNTNTGQEMTDNIDLRGLLGRVEAPLKSEEDVAAAQAKREEKAKEIAGQMKPPTDQQDDQQKQNDATMRVAASVERVAALLDGDAYVPTLSLDASDADGQWVTINGVHVLIKGGKIVKGPKRFIGKTTAEAKAHKQSEKSRRSAANAVAVKADIQRYSEEHNEPHLANALKDKKAGRNAVSLRDNEPTDVLVTHEGRIEHGVELKTMVANTNDKITMSKSALAKKQAWVAANKAPIHTVVYDDRAVFNANGEGQHGNIKNRKIYYKRGGGSFRTGSMHQVKDVAELKSLIAMPDHALPVAAQPTATWSAATARHMK